MYNPVNFREDLGILVEMNAFDEVSPKEVLELRLSVLRGEHTGVDREISELQENPHIDQLFLRRLKKRKLLLKDQIAKIESQLFPDIIA